MHVNAIWIPISTNHSGLLPLFWLLESLDFGDIYEIHTVIGWIERGRVYEREKLGKKDIARERARVTAARQKYFCSFFLSHREHRACLPIYLSVWIDDCLNRSLLTTGDECTLHITHHIVHSWTCANKHSTHIYCIHSSSNLVGAYDNRYATIVYDAIDKYAFAL